MDRVFDRIRWQMVEEGPSDGDELCPECEGCQTANDGVMLVPCPVCEGTGRNVQWLPEPPSTESFTGWAIDCGYGASPRWIWTDKTLKIVRIEELPALQDTDDSDA